MLNLIIPQYLARGAERYEEYFSRILRKQMVQYDYRSRDGMLFSCLAPTLIEARARRDQWLSQNAAAKTLLALSA